MSHGDEDDKHHGRRIGRRGSRPAIGPERAQVRRWRLYLRVEGFTDEQAARLIVTKLLHSRRSLRG